MSSMYSSSPTPLCLNKPLPLTPPHKGKGRGEKIKKAGGEYMEKRTENLNL